MTSLCLPGVPAGLLTGFGVRSAGPTGQLLAKQTVDAVKSLKADASAGSTFVFQDLQLLAEENGTTLQDSKVFALAQKFLLSFPLQSGIPAPELALDADGEIALDWIAKGGRMLTISLREDGRVSYAARLSPLDKEHGTKQFADSVPPKLLQLARQITAG